MRKTWVLAAVVAMLGALPMAALAQEGGLPVVTLGKDVEVLVGEEIEVTVEGMPGGSTVTVSTCWVLPVTGPNDCELSDFGQHSITVDGTGTGTATYVLPAGPAERCATEGECFIVVSHGIGAQSISNGAPITYAVEQPTAAAETTVAAPETTTTVAETTTTAPETTTTVAATTTEPAEEEGGGLSTGVIIGIAIVAVAAAAVGFFAARNRGGTA